MKAKKWNYEEDITRTERLIERTVTESQRPAWGQCAALIMAALREAKPEATPLVLHFVDISATEMLENRHDNARLCLVTAMSMVDKRLGAVQHKLFISVFSQAAQHIAEKAPAGAPAPSSELVSFIQNFMNQVANGQVPQGAKKIDLGHGMVGFASELKPLPMLKLPGGDYSKN